MNNDDGQFGPIFFLFILFSIVLVSCYPILPSSDPDLGDYNDILKSTTINRYINVRVVRSGFEQTNGKSIELEITNLSDQKMEVLINEVRIFRVEKDEWVNVQNTSKYYLIDFLDPEAETKPAISLSFEPRGVFPGDTHLLNVSPDVSNIKSGILRIYVIGHLSEPFEDLEIVGAVVNVPFSQ